MLASGLLKDALQAEGVMVTKKGGGHTDVDLMENCNACEHLGIRTVLIDNEWLGPNGTGEFPLMASSPNADAMVSVGNQDGLVKLPATEGMVQGPSIPAMGSKMGKKVKQYPGDLSSHAITDGSSFSRISSGASKN